MAPMDADKTETAGFAITAATGVPAECGAAFAAAAPVRTEHVADIRTEPVIQLDWVDMVETMLRQLQHRDPEDPVLVEAIAAAARLRVAINASGTPEKSTGALWLCLYFCITLPFLHHFSSAVGNDLGHAMAHQIVKILSSITHRFEF
jgi:hypothetical protein